MRSKVVISILLLVVLIISGVSAFIPVTADDEGTRCVGGSCGDGEASTLQPSPSDIYLPNKAAFAESPKEHRVMPIYTGIIDEANIADMEDHEVGGLVVNSWQWNDTLMAQAESYNWTVWVNDYYMYPSGNANPHGGVHETFWNPGFETSKLGLWPDGWIWSYYDWPNYDTTGAQARTGTDAIACDDMNQFFWPFGVIPGETYNISAWARGDPGTTHGRLIMLWYNIDSLIHMNITVYPVSTNWEKRYIQAEAPPDATACRMIVAGHESKKLVWFDDVMVRRMNSSATNMIVNPSLETDIEPDGTPDGWSESNTPTYDESGTNAHTGTDAALVDVSNAYLQIHPVKPGTDYYFGEWVKGTTGTELAQLAILWLNETYQMNGFSNTVFQASTTYTWQDMKIMAPLNASYAAPVLASASLDSVFIDDVVFMEEDPLNYGVSRGPVLDGHPELEAQGLYYAHEDVTAPGTVNLTLPYGNTISVVACPLSLDGSVDVHAPTDLSSFVVNGTLTWSPLVGSWKVMAFTIDILYNGTEVDPAITNMHQINVMNPNAVSSFLTHMHENTIRAEHGQYFGDMIQATFTDEVSNMAAWFLEDMPYPVVAWVHDEVNGHYLNETFQDLHGYDIIDYLPALFNDVGASTGKYRCDFYNTTGWLQGQTYYKMNGDWCENNGINFSGHLLAEDHILHQIAFYGDVYESIQHMGYPGIDALIRVAGEMDTEVIVPKLAASAAVMYDKEHVMTEYSVASTSMNYRNMSAVANWQMVQGVDIVTSFSFYRGVVPKEELQNHSKHVGRTGYMMNQGEYKTDIAVLYPTTTFQAEYTPSTAQIWNLDAFTGNQHDRSFTNLTKELQRNQLDFIYVDDVSMERMIIEENGGTPVLHHPLSGQRFKVLIIPEMFFIQNDTLAIINEFYNSGGTILAVGDLPYGSAEHGEDNEVINLIDDIFNPQDVPGSGYKVMESDLGGKAIWIVGDVTEVTNALNEHMDLDMVIEDGPDEFIWYSKRDDVGFSSYFLINNNASDHTHEISFRCQGDPQAWYPDNGTVVDITGFTYDPETGYTTIPDLTVHGFSSVFVVFVKPVLNLVLEDQTIIPMSPNVGDMRYFAARVYNIGHGMASNVSVFLYNGNPNTDGELIDGPFYVSVTPGVQTKVDMEWDTTGDAGDNELWALACMGWSGCIMTNLSMYVNSPPVPVINASDNNVLTGVEITFNGNLSTDVDGPDLNYTWDLGDNTTAFGVLITHSYSDDGEYNVTLSVMDDNLVTVSTNKIITILNRAPTASFTHSVSQFTDGSRNLDIFEAANDTDLDGTLVNYTWDMGDDTTLYGQMVDHDYATPGNFTVNLTVTDDDSGMGYYEEIIVVDNDPPYNYQEYVFFGDVTTIFEFNITIMDNDGEVVEWFWDFGDGTNSTDKVPTHQYNDDGIYNATGRGRDDWGDWGPDVHIKVTVENLGPSAAINSSNTTIKEDDLIFLDALNSTDPDDDLDELTFHWDLGDGNTSDLIELNHSYEEEGDYRIILTITDDDGASSNTSILVRVDKKDEGGSGGGGGTNPPVQDGEDGQDNTSFVVMAVIMGVAILLVGAVFIAIFLFVTMKNKQDAEHQDDEDEEIVAGPTADSSEKELALIHQELMQEDQLEEAAKEDEELEEVDEEMEEDIEESQDGVEVWEAAGSEAAHEEVAEEEEEEEEPEDYDEEEFEDPDDDILLPDDLTDDEEWDDD